MDPKAFSDNSPGQVLRVPEADYWAFVPHPLPPVPDWTPALAAQLSEADRALGELAGLGRLLPNPHILIAPFMHREAVLSSQIEGTRASLSDLYAYEAHEAVQAPGFGGPSDVREVRNYILALEHGLERLSTLPLSLHLIRELHAHLMEDVRGEERTPGEFRRSQNWIGPPGCTLSQATYVPPPPEHLPESLHAFEDYLHTDSSSPPLVRLALIHYQFEAIHPFLDGNGRVGRLLITLLLCAWKLLPETLLYLCAFFEANRREYYDGLLAVSKRGAWEEWLLFFLQGVTEQSRDAVLRAGRLQEIHEAYHGYFQSKHAAARLLQVVDLLFYSPIVTVPYVAQRLEVSYVSANRYVSTLEEHEILREITGRSRNRVYQADHIIHVINAPVS
ncbi:MAG: Fic family protein [Anaerolineales bacterium]|nr:MAG: Fic family protein [Anaerolineales bacterium]